MSFPWFTRKLQENSIMFSGAMSNLIRKSWREKKKKTVTPLVSWQQDSEALPDSIRNTSAFQKLLKPNTKTGKPKLLPSFSRKKTIFSSSDSYIKEMSYTSALLCVCAHTCAVCNMAKQTYQINVQSSKCDYCASRAIHQYLVYIKLHNVNHINNSAWRL